MTRAQMRDQVKFWLGLQDIAGFDETGLIYDQLHYGTIDLLARTKCVVRCLDLNVSAGTDTYTLDHLVLALVDIQDGARRRARRDQSLGDVPGIVIYPAGSVPLYRPTFTLIRADILRLSPVPDVNGSVQTWAVLRPAQMTADSQSPGDEAYGAIPDEFQDAIVTYALWKCADYADDSSAQQGERYRMLYEGQDGRGGRLAQIRSAVNKRGTARAPGRRVSLGGIRPRRDWVG